MFDAENGGIQKDFIPTTVLTKTGMDAKVIVYYCIVFKKSAL